MSNLYELSKEEIEADKMLKDTKLFMQLLPLFEKMSKRGKQATIDTFIIRLLEEEKEKC